MTNTEITMKIKHLVAIHYQIEVSDIENRSKKPIRVAARVTLAYMMHKYMKALTLCDIGRAIAPYMPYDLTSIKHMIKTYNDWYDVYEEFRETAKAIESDIQALFSHKQRIYLPHPQELV